MLNSYLSKYFWYFRGIDALIYRIQRKVLRSVHSCIVLVLSEAKHIL
ncbi:hypothetical protein ACA081_00835 [Candidatus Hodgkinia cicadicola]